MKLDLSDVLREIGRNATYAVEMPPIVDEDIECTLDITGSIDFINTGGNLIIRGNAATRTALTCSRCDRYFDLPVTFKIEEEFELLHSHG